MDGTGVIQGDQSCCQHSPHVLETGGDCGRTVLRSLIHNGIMGHRDTVIPAEDVEAVEEAPMGGRRGPWTRGCGWGSRGPSPGWEG